MSFGAIFSMSEKIDKHIKALCLETVHKLYDVFLGDWLSLGISQKKKPAVSNATLYIDRIGKSAAFSSVMQSEIMLQLFAPFIEVFVNFSSWQLQYAALYGNSIISCWRFSELYFRRILAMFLVEILSSLLRGRGKHMVAYCLIYRSLVSRKIKGKYSGCCVQKYTNSNAWCVQHEWLNWQMILQTSV